ncbi:MAG: 5-amino-6-(D-ribitylamino)uracil--L-tyrosine 4-hydroxyphenyl transferase CofH [Candidatus Jordarchaeaceae archaeon]
MNLLDIIDGKISHILNRAIDGHPPSVDEAELLFSCTGQEFLALIIVANHIRKRAVGDIVTYVVNRNINFTNVCVNSCRFCAFREDINSPKQFLLSTKEIENKTREAVEMGATEVCIQGGLHPEATIDLYLQILKAVRRISPDIHIHAFSPMEIHHAAKMEGLSTREVLKILKEAGLDSMPGTAAEILVDKIREIICPNKISVEEWIKIIEEAHNLGIPTSSTMMYGHIESSRDKAVHMDILRKIQRRTKGFTEFVPLSFVHQHTELYKKFSSRPGATGMEDVKVYAISRLMFDGLINNIQVSWVKLGTKFAQFLLNAGANDFGGTLFEENISRIAGSASGEYLSPERIIALIKDCGRIPVQRTTLYQLLS